MLDHDRKDLRDIALLFLRLGSTAFGGPAAHIAMMEDEVVRRRQWMTHPQFLDLLGATNLIPGPNSTEMAIHIGHLRAGWRGLIVAGVCFIFPAVIIVMALAWVYVHMNRLPQFESIFYGIKPVIIAIVIQAIWGLSRSAVKTKFLLLLAIAAAVANFRGVNELVVLFSAAALTVVWKQVTTRRGTSTFLALPIFAPAAASGGGALGAASALYPGGVWPLFFFFLKVGSVLYGSGYVLLAFLQSGLVEHYGWLTQAQLLDAIAVGQFTPGPVFTTATFVGYLLGGSGGALAATLGIFLPSFLFVALSAPFIPRLRSSKVFSAFLDGVNVGSLALMGVAALQLGRAAVVDIWTAVLAIFSALLLVKYRINSMWLVLGGAIVGIIGYVFQTF